MQYLQPKHSFSIENNLPKQITNRQQLRDISFAWNIQSNRDIIKLFSGLIWKLKTMDKNLRSVKKISRPAHDWTFFLLDTGEICRSPGQAGTPALNVCIG